MRPCDFKEGLVVENQRKKKYEKQNWKGKERVGGEFKIGCAQYPQEGRSNQNGYKVGNGVPICSTI
jgi:hypothetical protein